ncbi:HTH domain-containing protein [Maribacter sp. 2-571]|uniref:HTH domain-containing protein n=1 Tax=Maribacter sp. 2-571 TaxID=3417569 RepID=UPI003D32FDF7
MNSIRNIERLQRLHKLIQQEVTGPPATLATRLHISERLVYNLVDQLKDLRATIRYDRSRKTYYYVDYFQFEVRISVSVQNHKMEN